MSSSALRTELDSGAVVVSEAMAAVESVSFGLHFPTGSRYETTQNNGISHFIEHLVFKGTKARSVEEINREIDLLGGGSNAYTSKETLCFHTRVLAEHLERAVALFSDLATHALPEGVEPEIERERDVILSEISAVEDSPEDLVGDLCDHAYFGEHPLALPVTGSARAVQRMSPGDLRAHFSRHIVSQGMVVAAAGRVDHERLVALAREHLEAVPGRNTPHEISAPPRERSCRVLERDLEQVHVCLSAAGLSRLDERRRAAELLSIIVGDGYSSRLFREVREQRGLAYSVYTSLAGYIDSGSFNVYFAVAPEKLDEALQVVGHVLAGVRSGGVTEDELAAAKQHLRTSIVLGHESTGARMGYLAEQCLLDRPELSLEQELQGIEGVRLAELRDLVGELLDGELALAAVGPVAEDRFGPGGWRLPV